MNVITNYKRAVFLLTLALFFLGATFVDAATLRLTPATGVYQAGSTFTAQVQVLPGSGPINAAEGTLSFNTNELSVVAVNRTNSIFNLWVAEPTFSNTAGTISFSGGVPSGYTGRVGSVLSVTFRAINAGSPRVSFTNGSVLANDGRGTNVLTAMNGGTFTIQAASAAPEPERIIEYVAPANTPGAPQITSQTHADPTGWHNNKTAQLQWQLPAGVTEVRTLLNQSPTSIPTRVYEDPISSITLEDLPEGESYFHLQFRNADGWGRVTHYRLAVDTGVPTNFVITAAEDNDTSSPEQTLQLQIDDETSSVRRFFIKIDADEPYEYIDEAGTGLVQLPALAPGYHTVIIEAFDQAGNSVIDTFSFTILAFEKPVFFEVPSEMSGDVIPVIKGLTRPMSEVSIFFRRVGAEPNVYVVQSDEMGEFTFIPEGQLFTGVYEITAQSVDQNGAQSEVSDIKRIAVQEPGYIRFGNQMVDAMSIIVPLTLLTLLLFLGVWYVFFLLRRFKGAVRVESKEALDILHREFSTLQSELRTQEAALQNARKTHKLSKAEADTIKAIDLALQRSQRAVEKEIQDVTKLTSQD